MSQRVSTRVLAVLAASLLVFCAGCRSMYYGTMEKFGVHKRDILVDRVEEGRDAQQDAKEQFRDALEAFRAVSEFDGGDLEKTYNKLNKELERSESRAKDVRSRIASIEEVSADLFKEWAKEIETMESADLRSRSEQTLESSKQRYSDLIATMKQAESKMEPVLVAFRDHVLFLKHNLNAQAIDSLDSDLMEIESDVASLIEDMEASIAEADAFIESMEGAG